MQVPQLRFTDSLMDQVSDSCYKYTELFAVPNVELNVDSIYEVTVYWWMVSVYVMLMRINYYVIVSPVTVVADDYCREWLETR